LRGEGGWIGEERRRDRSDRRGGGTTIKEAASDQKKWNQNSACPEIWEKKKDTSKSREKSDRLSAGGRDKKEIRGKNAKSREKDG